MAQTETPFELINLPDKRQLTDRFVGKDVHMMRTPAFILDRNVIIKNCAKMHERSRDWGASFRAHLKTHKTTEGAELQLRTSIDTTNAVIVSTLMEAWQVVKSGLVEQGIVKDMLYGMPLPINKILDLALLQGEMRKYGSTIRILIDHPVQVQFLEKHLAAGQTFRWSVFVKVDAGYGRAGLRPASPEFKALLSAALESPVVSVYGFYTHSGNAYSSESTDAATSFLSQEVEAVNAAAGLAKYMLDQSAYAEYHQQPFVLSVGSTPAAHAASAETRMKLHSMLNGKLELHAGNYPLLDLQQMATGMVNANQIAQRVLSTVVSYYPGRGKNGADEAMCDAGGIAMSKDTGPWDGYGEVVGKPWKLTRISQEHGIITQDDSAAFQSISPFSMPSNGVQIGDLIEIVGQHACMIAAAYPWYYVVDSSENEGKGPRKVVDVWVPWRGW